jgi:hypothetical protein
MIVATPPRHNQQASDEHQHDDNPQNSHHSDAMETLVESQGLETSTSQALIRGMVFLFMFFLLYTKDRDYLTTHP